MSEIAMETNLRESVERYFEELVRKHRFRVHAAAYDRQDFGNAVVVLESEDCSIRVVRDRGKVFVEVASPVEPGNWFPIERALRAAGVSGHEIGGAMELEAVASLIDTNYSELAEALGPPHYLETKRKLERLGEIAKQEFLRRIQPGR